MHFFRGQARVWVGSCLKNTSASLSPAATMQTQINARMISLQSQDIKVFAFICHSFKLTLSASFPEKKKNFNNKKTVIEILVRPIVYSVAPLPEELVMCMDILQKSTGVVPFLEKEEQPYLCCIWYVALGDHSIHNCYAA